MSVSVMYIYIYKLMEISLKYSVIDMFNNIFLRTLNALWTICFLIALTWFSSNSALARFGFEPTTFHSLENPVRARVIRRVRNITSRSAIILQYSIVCFFLEPIRLYLFDLMQPVSSINRDKYRWIDTQTKRRQKLYGACAMFKRSSAITNDINNPYINVLAFRYISKKYKHNVDNRDNKINKVSYKHMCNQNPVLVFVGVQISWAGWVHNQLGRRYHRAIPWQICPAPSIASKIICPFSGTRKDHVFDTSQELVG